MKKLGFFLLIILIFNSCASIFNGTKTVVKISADEESLVDFQNDSIIVDKKQIVLRPKRSKKPLEIEIIKDSVNDKFSFEHRVSSLYWMNIFSNYGIGLLVDLTNDKRFTYKRNIHFANDNKTKKIMLSDKKITKLPKNKFFLYTSPLQALDFFSIPIFTLGTEFFIRDNFSLSAEYGFRNSNFHNNEVNVTYLEEKAKLYRIETKFYNGINVLKNVHVNEYWGIEFREIKSQYNDKIEYSFINGQNTFIEDDFATRKRVSIINLKYGFIMPIGKRFYFDFYTGFGIRIKKFDYINLEYNEAIHLLEEDNFFSFDFREFNNYTKKSTLNYSLGFKFGIKL
jgi:hypothetical protein